MIITGKLDNPQPFGPYMLMAKVASGGMATVYLAEAQRGSPLYGKPLALKHLHPHLAENEDFVRMFSDEGRVAQQLDHPNVVRVFDVGSVDTDRYLVMEYVEGRDLAQIITAMRLHKSTIPTPIAFEILRQTLTALSYIHGFKGSGNKKMGIVHRDISPQNILISRYSMIKLTDFGIARGAHRTDRTRTGTVKGKMHYMAPEQAAGERVDHRADLYAVGAVAFEMLTGRPAFGAEKTSVLHRKAMAGDLDLEGKFKTQPEDVKAWLLRAMGRSAEERFQSADAMLAAMELLSRANRAGYRPEHLTRLLELHESRRSVQTEARNRELFVGDDAVDLGRLAGAVSRNYQTLQSESKVRGPQSHVDLSGDERRNRLLERKVDWEQTGPEPRPAPDARPSNAETLRPRGRAAAEMLPAERAVGRSYAVAPSGEFAVQRPAMASSSQHAAVAAAPSGKQMRTEGAVVEAKRQVSTISRGDLDRERGIAMAAALAWVCGAFMSFAVLLEIVGWTPELPVINETMVASLVSDGDGKLDASSGSPARPAPPTHEKARDVAGLASSVTATSHGHVDLAAASTAATRDAGRKVRYVADEDIARSVIDARPLERVVPFESSDGSKAARNAKAAKPALLKSIGSGEIAAAKPLSKPSIAIAAVPKLVAKVGPKAVAVAGALPKGPLSKDRPLLAKPVGVKPVAVAKGAPIRPSPLAGQPGKKAIPVANAGKLPDGVKSAVAKGAVAVRAAPVAAGGKALAPTPAAAKPGILKPVVAKPGAAKPVSVKPAGPIRGIAKAVSAPAAAPKALAGKAIFAKAGAVRAVASKPVAPAAGGAKPAVAKVLAPKAGAPKPVSNIGAQKPTPAKPAAPKPVAKAAVSAQNRPAAR